jgi:hypothetical protein
MEAGEWRTASWEHFCTLLVPPGFPETAPDTAAAIEAAAGEQALMVTWYEEAEWHYQAMGRDTQLRRSGP